MDRTIVHFEIPAKDPAKLSQFYSKLFGWSFEKMEGSGAGMDYWTIKTRDKDDSAGVNGGMMKKTDANQTPLNYVLVESVDEFSKKLVQLGGKIIMPKTEIPNMGNFAVALDPEGNGFGIFETKGQ
jgi:predicted enzyme related to lactoylglutathione lyase